MKKIVHYLVLLWCIFFFPKSTIAQTSDFKLKDYTLPDLHFQSLDTRFHFRHSNSNSRTDNNSGPDNQVSNNSASGNLSLSYNQFKNNLRWQRNTFASVRLSSNFSDNITNQNSGRRQFLMGSSVFLNSTNRRYQSSKNTFYELDLDLDTDFSKKKITDYNPTLPTVKRNAVNLDLSLSIGLKAGVGRIDQVTDSRQAILILQALEKEHRLERTLDDEEITEFAKLISKINRKRFFDVRIQKIYELETVDSFLQEKNLIANTDIRYFTTLNDLWRFGGGPVRFSGQRFSVALIPGYDLNQNGMSFGHPSNAFKVTNIHTGLEYVLEKPLNIYLQSGLDLYAYVGYLQGTVQNDNFEAGIIQELQIPKLNIGFKKRLSYYPNTRTIINQSLHFQYARLQDWFANNAIKLDGQGWRVGFDLDMTYYVSPRFRIFAMARVNYNHFNTDEDLNTLSNIQQYANRVQFLANQPRCGNNADCSFQLNQNKKLNFLFDLSMTYALF